MTYAMTLLRRRDKGRKGESNSKAGGRVQGPTQGGAPCRYAGRKRWQPLSVRSACLSLDCRFAAATCCSPFSLFSFSSRRRCDFCDRFRFVFRLFPDRARGSRSGYRIPDRDRGPPPTAGAAPARQHHGWHGAAARRETSRRNATLPRRGRARRSVFDSLQSNRNP